MLLWDAKIVEKELRLFDCLMARLLGCSKQVKSYTTIKQSNHHAIVIFKPPN